MVVKHRVAVLLADAGRAVKLAELLEKQGVSAVLTTSSDELYQAFNRNPIDVIVIEHRLAGFLTGLEILERLFNDLLRPATTLVGELSREEQRRLHALGATCVLPPDAGPDDVVAAVQGLLARVQQHEEVISPLARKLVQRADYIQPLPQLLVKLVGYLRDEEIDAKRVVRDLSVDPLLTADVLKFANSAALGRRQKTAKISDAVAYLGPRKAIGVAISTGMMRARGALVGDLPPSLHHWHSSRAVLSACTAAAFAGRLEKVSEESAYILGLVQDLGILVMARGFGERYVEALYRVQRIAHLRLEHVEQDCYNVTHADVSAALLRKWEFPNSFVSLVRKHHDSDPRDHAQTDQRFLRAMQIGEALCDLHDNRSAPRYFALQHLLEPYGGQTAAECRACLAEAVTKTVESSEIFSVPAPRQDVLQAMLRDLAQRPEFRELTAPSHGEAAPGEPPQPLVPAPAAPEPAAPHPSASAPPEPSTKVLVIDDDPALVKTIRLYLRDWDYRVLACETAEEARRLVPQASAILCDIHLGAENGVDVVRQLRADGYTGPIVVVSGDGLRATVLDCLEAGVSDYLLKPFSKVQLIEKLRRRLHG